eukprot:PITA_32892
MIEEETYIELPEGFEAFNGESHVCRLKQVLYELKQVPHAWYTRIDNYFTGLGFTKSEADANLYHSVVEGKFFIKVLYVDDLILICDEKLMKSCKEDTAREFKMKHLGLMHYFLEGVKLQGFTDADWTGIPSDRKRTSGGILTVGSTNVSWYIKKQRSVALSSIEVKYMANIQASCEAIWMRKIIVGLFGQQMDPIVIYYDNQSCIKLYENLVFHDRSKHINIWYHHLRDCV